MAVKKKVSKSDNAGNGTACAILSYFVIGIVWYFADDNMKKNSLARFHAKQGLVLLLAGVIIGAVRILLLWIPFIGKLIVWIVGVVFLVLWIFGIVNSATGQEKPLPIIGGFAEKLEF